MFITSEKINCLHNKVTVNSAAWPIYMFQVMDGLIMSVNVRTVIKEYHIYREADL